MKLVGSNIEKEIRSSLIESKLEPFDFDGDIRLLNLLRKNKPNLKFAYIIDWTPEQGEDIYIVVTDDQIIFKIEIDRVDKLKEPSWESSTLDDYSLNIKGKQAQLKIEVVRKLINENIRDGTV